MVDAATGGTDLHVVTVPRVLGEEGVALFVQADDEELSQVLRALHGVLVHLGRMKGWLSGQDFTLIPKPPTPLASHPGPAHAAETGF